MGRSCSAENQPGSGTDIAVEAASRIVRSSLTEEAQRKLVDDYIKELPRDQKEGRA